MIKTVAALLVISAGTAAADSAVELAGGFALPVSDSDWTNLVDPSPKLGVRVTAGRPDIEAMVLADWSPLAPATNPAFTELRFNRFRVLAGGQFRHAVTPAVTLSVRLGLGIDIAHAGYTIDAGPFGRSESSDTDVGLAFEPAVAIWYSLGKTQLGFELALPYGHHDKMGSLQQGDFTFHYTSLDVDLLGVVRFGT